MDQKSAIQKSLDYIEDNIDAQLSHQELARQAGYSLYHYYRLFHRAVGMPLGQYILQRRLLHAIYDIRQGCKGIDAALRYGFETYGGFYKAFLRAFSCTPSDYIRQNRVRRPYRLNLYQEESMPITHKKAAQILRNWDLHQPDIQEVYNETNGNRKENILAVNNSCFLKYTANLGALKTHLALTNALSRGGLHCPVVVPTVQGGAYVQEDGSYYLLTRRLEGQPLGISQIFGGSARFLGEIIGRLHLALRQVECVVENADLLETISSWALPQTRELLGLTEAFSRQYLNSLSALLPELPRQIIHRDLHPGNILLDGDHCGFLDFALSQKNVRIYDPCYAATAVLSESCRENDPAFREQWLEVYREIFAGYDSVISLTEAEKQAVPYVLLSNQLICVAWFAGQPQHRELLDRNVAMTKWLVGSFARLSLA